MKQKIEFDILEGQMKHPNADVDLITYTFKGESFEEFTLASEVELEPDQLEDICINTLHQDGLCDADGYQVLADLIDFHQDGGSC